MALISLRFFKFIKLCRKLYQAGRFSILKSAGMSLFLTGYINDLATYFFDTVSISVSNIYLLK